MLRVAAVVLLLTALALAGCTGDDAKTVPLSAIDEPSKGKPPAQPQAGVETEQPPAKSGEAVMTISGVVQDEDGAPIPEATVSIPELNRTRKTGADGAFVFQNVPVGFHVLHADATNYQAAELTAKPVESGGSVSLVFVLLQFAEEPYFVTVHFEGLIQCAAEYVIITPSCDTATEYVATELKNGGVPVPSDGSVTDNETEFRHHLLPNWRTVVLDMDFDEASQPGMDGLRITVRGTSDADRLNDYEQYAKFYGGQTYRLEPGAEYEDGTGPVPQNATTFEYQVYPRSHGYHAACVPAAPIPFGGTCFLGVGAGIDVAFDLYATAFYVDPAPDAWSFLA